ncbi:MAG: hypothetical protein IT385_00760 [Deltaproteobacteria bacterium]|nr:hypothetical protein [Deltaproteobacteria bacterium]
MSRRWGGWAGPVGWVLACALVVLASEARAQSAIGLGATFFFDSGEREDDERIGPRHDVTREDVTNPRFAAGVISYLHALSDTPREGFRLGGELRYLGTYATESDDDEGRRDIGTLFELGFRGEWTTEIADKLGLALGLRLDLAMVFPTGDFAAEIDRLADEGVPTSSGPRFGWSIVPMVGARYELHERVHARLDLGLGWSALELLGIDETVQGIAYQRDETLSVTRFEVSLAIELSL